MKTRFNLYLPEFKPPKELLSVARIVIVCLVVMALMLGWMFLVRGQYATMQQQSSKADSQLASINEDIATIQQRIASRSSSDQISGELERAKARYESKRRLADVLSQFKYNTDSNYSSLLLELAKVSNSQMAIESIKAVGRVVTIKGKTVTAGAVADFVESFKSLDYLHNLSFASIEVGSNDNASSTDKNNSDASGAKTGLLSFSLTGFDPVKNKGKSPQGGSK